MSSVTSSPRRPQPVKKRGSYNCGRCGLPKKGHVCTVADSPAADPRPPPRSDHRLRRALSFDDDVAEAPKPVPALVYKESYEEEEEEGEEEEMVGVGRGVHVPLTCLVEVLRRLPPRGLVAAAAVCRGWRECAKRMWRSAEELRIRVLPKSQIGSVGSLLNKCAGLTRLTLRMESDVDYTMLACVAFSCPNLEALEISLANHASNKMTGDELNRFVSEKRCLSVLKIEGCTNLGFLNLSSTSLTILWLSNLYSISKSVINCPNLKELSLDFSKEENDSTDVVAVMDSVGRTCPRLRNLHVASIRLCNEAILALASTNLRYLRMLSLILGFKITDAAVAAIVQSFSSLEWLDLSGSSVSDSGVGMISKAYSRTLSKLLLALCPNITSSGVQLAAAQLPYLELIDCGMSLSNNNNNSPSEENKASFNENTLESRNFLKTPSKKPHSLNQKLIIEHGNLRKLSLWGCSGLDALYVNCPELNDLNLNSCTNLNPERLLLQCPNLQKVHASGCKDMLIGAIRNQVLNEFTAAENFLPFKRLADGSKRVHVPHFLSNLPYEDEKRKRIKRGPCTVNL